MADIRKGRFAGSVMAVATFLCFTNLQMAYADDVGWVAAHMDGGCANFDGSGRGGGGGAVGGCGFLWIHCISRVAEDTYAAASGTATGLLIGVGAALAVGALIASAPVWGAVAVVAGAALTAYGIYTTVASWNRMNEQQKIYTLGMWGGSIAGGGIGGLYAPAPPGEAAPRGPATSGGAPVSDPPPAVLADPPAAPVDLPPALPSGERLAITALPHNPDTHLLQEQHLYDGEWGLGISRGEGPVVGMRFPWSDEQGLRDAQSVYQQSPILQELSEMPQDRGRAMSVADSARQAINDAAREQGAPGLAHGRIFWIARGETMPWVPGPLASHLQAYWDPVTNGIYLRASLADDPVLQVQELSRAYGAYLLGRYYFSRYIADLAAQRGSPLSEEEIAARARVTLNGFDLIPKGPSFGVTDQLDFLVGHHGSDPAEVAALGQAGTQIPSVAFQAALQRMQDAPTQGALKQAWQAAIQEFHPDRAGEAGQDPAVQRDLSDKFAEINTLYQELKPGLPAGG